MKAEVTTLGGGDNTLNLIGFTILPENQEDSALLLLLGQSNTDITINIAMEGGKDVVYRKGAKVSGGFLENRKG